MAQSFEPIQVGSVRHIGATLREDDMMVQIA